MNKYFLDVHRVIKLKYLPHFSSKWFEYGFYHYIYVSKGTGFIIINDKEYLANEGEIYLIARNKLHLKKNYNDQTFNTIEIKFSVNDPEIINAIDSFPDYLTVPDQIHLLMDLIVSEAKNKNLFFKKVINIKCAELILNLIRYNENVKKKEKVKEPDIQYLPDEKRFISVIEFIEKNLNKNISIKELAIIANLSETYFCKAFKEVYGISPINYINKRKHLGAKKMLKYYPSFNISQIANALGFNSVHYFSRFFKRMEGISPMKYIVETIVNLRIKID